MSQALSLSFLDKQENQSESHTEKKNHESSKKKLVVSADIIAFFFIKSTTNKRKKSFFVVANDKTHELEKKRVFGLKLV